MVRRVGKKGKKGGESRNKRAGGFRWEGKVVFSGFGGVEERRSV